MILGTTQFCMHIVRMIIGTIFIQQSLKLSMNSQDIMKVLSMTTIFFLFHLPVNLVFKINILFKNFYNDPFDFLRSTYMW